MVATCEVMIQLALHCSLYLLESSHKVFIGTLLKLSYLCTRDCLSQIAFVRACVSLMYLEGKCQTVNQTFPVKISTKQG